MYKNSLTSRPHVMKLCRNALKTYWTDARKNGYDCVPGYDYIHLFVLLCLVLSIYISKRPKNDDLNLARWKKTKNRVLSDLLSIHESSQNTVTTRSCWEKKIKIVFPYALWCFHLLSQTPVTTPKLSRISCFPGIT